VRADSGGDEWHAANVIQGRFLPAAHPLAAIRRAPLRPDTVLYRTKRQAHRPSFGRAAGRSGLGNRT
jgi:hypothetical protein